MMMKLMMMLKSYDLKGLGNVAQSLSQCMIAFQSHIDTRAVQCVPLQNSKSFPHEN